uniref:Uncharacterized protein n=1 Tax=Timema cristinae TaxID=61476 RepID=A0A7R9DK81_TIMCR|nr:unnamed protein product [Timema cristinae]
MGQRKKKYQSGEGSKYVTRQAALRMLQLTLKNFRSLCILKGIYPREPHNRKKAQRGTPGIKILYNKKDIQFLLHEPIIWKLRDIKVIKKKLYSDVILFHVLFHDEKGNNYMVRWENHRESEQLQIFSKE